MKAILTKHSINRMHQRLGVHKCDAKHVADMALQNGITHKQAKGGLKKYISGLYLSQRNANNIRIYKNGAYLFLGNKLLTVIKLPDKFVQKSEKPKRVKESKEHQMYRKYRLKILKQGLEIAKKENNQVLINNYIKEIEEMK